MAAKFLFIIPLTPIIHLTDNRLALRKLCFNTLLKQRYPDWTALIIGEISEEEIPKRNFLHLNFEGQKEEKLQKASEYILKVDLVFDYVIRLDDDDLFNPKLLESIADKNFDIYLDKYHSFLDISTGLVSQKIMYWFPNTCIHKKQHAFSIFGSFPPGNYTRFKEKPFLIENEHNDFHHYYDQDHQIIFSKKNNPVYLRVLNSDSITSIQASNKVEYMNQFGYWKKNNLVSFSFLNEIQVNKSIKNVQQGMAFLFNAIKTTIIAEKNYNKMVIKK